jgi:hypothetical protein
MEAGSEDKVGDGDEGILKNLFEYVNKSLCKKKRKGNRIVGG